MDYALTTTLPLVLLSLVWFRLAAIDLRYLLPPHRVDAAPSRLEHQVTAMQTTGRAHDVLHVPNDPETHREPDELVAARVVRRLDPRDARGLVVSVPSAERRAQVWDLTQELPHRA